MLLQWKENAATLKNKHMLGVTKPKHLQFIKTRGRFFIIIIIIQEIKYGNTHTELVDFYNLYFTFQLVLYRKRSWSLTDVYNLHTQTYFSCFYFAARINHRNYAAPRAEKKERQQKCVWKEKTSPLKFIRAALKDDGRKGWVSVIVLAPNKVKQQIQNFFMHKFQ